MQDKMILIMLIYMNKKEVIVYSVHIKSKLINTQSGDHGLLEMGKEMVIS